MPPKKDDGLAKMQRKIRKRGYMRTFMQVYRNRERCEVERLKAQVEELELDLAKRLVERKAARSEKTTKSSPLESELPWKEVAKAMYEMSQEVATTRRMLQHDAAEAEVVGLDLQGWAPLSSRCQTWRDVTLLSHPRSRQLGKQWITQHMYHNANRIFQQQECPPAYYNIIDNSWDIDFSSGECYYIVERGHVDWNMSLANVQSMFRNHMCSMFTIDAFCPLTTNTLAEASDNTVLHQLVASGESSPVTQYVNLLGAEFNESHDRSVVVVTQIQDDEMAAHSATSLPQRSRMTCHRTRGRYVSIVSQQFTTRGGFVSMADEAREWGFDLSQVPPWEQEQLFVRLHRQRHEGLRASRQRWYSDLITQELTTREYAHTIKLEPASR
ncbi:hypothetical protein DYB25_011212 [Aphanomyces astaci]|uniref:Uncharacterized protein n=1 Tax=Aphanomyces astaci TaxID=112090 RepID=A0A397DZM9_APHAT|nr:hypothetical protein DYB25_011212 [Aphanomyces astaci]RHY40198.1 hypothetical protein DYB34_010798 [Aphanomyces astaci]RHY56574.1 hypothetical protein DYB38_005413 [Aphanomyces astaci]RHY70898.1 hypothetical protein DYB30_009998 [Aphanomyces astaci]RHZ15631.1 hypothetical protein DYB26_009948 [Aphanomyces astaci]